MTDADPTAHQRTHDHDHGHAPAPDAPWAHLVTPAPVQAAEAVPAHVAVIMDGNGRWAQARGLTRLQGHERGTDNIRRITSAAAEAGVGYLTLWAFSTENWRRPREEVEGIIRILGMCLVRDVDELHREGVQLRHIGELDGLPAEMRDQIRAAIELTSRNDRIVLTLAFNYGGRSELLRAVRELAAAGVAPEDITEDAIAERLYTAGMPDPDLIIRTSGEHRTSNFMVWQAAYAELYFTDTYWPDFGPDELREALGDYARRERRFGHVAAVVAPAG
jgi:undecaprenyl diphosphate synthase